METLDGDEVDEAVGRFPSVEVPSFDFDVLDQHGFRSVFDIVDVNECHLALITSIICPEQSQIVSLYEDGLGMQFQFNCRQNSGLVEGKSPDDRQNSS